jgi:DNA-binding response OmpR family regulator
VGADMFITKPFSNAEILDAVRSLGRGCAAGVDQ